MADTASSPAIVLEVSENVVVARVQCADLNETHVKSVRDELLGAIESHKQPFVVDLAKVKYIPSLSIGVLVRIAGDFKSGGQRLILVGVQPTVRKVLLITQLDLILEIQESVDAALQTLHA